MPKLKSLLVMTVLNLSLVSAVSASAGICRDGFYLGGIGGYGKTTWGELVPDVQSSAMSLSTPIHVSEGGWIWGVYGGYEFIPAFALEGSYMRYPDATLIFDPESLFTFFHDGETLLKTHTESLALVAKLMLPITPKFRAYSDFGIAGVHRYDNVTNRWRASPTFGFGFNLKIKKHLMFEFGTEYVAGYGQSEVEPTNHYIPFLYSGFVRLAYRF